MFNKNILIILILFFPKIISSTNKNRFVIWNVGQGSWSTLILSRHCIHFDFGGHWPGFPEECRQKQNQLWLTHYDWDHMSFAKRIQQSANLVCLSQKRPTQLSYSKKKILDSIPLCKRTLTDNIIWLYKSNFSIPNESHAFQIHDQVLISGDSSQKIEKIWLNHFALKTTPVLLAGHHGSRTSTSEDLLKSMLSLKMVFVSCEKKKYGHPHKETIKKLKKRKVPLINSESFGTVALEL